MSATFSKSGKSRGDSYHENLTETKICRQGLSDIIAKARAAHPELRLGQLFWNAAWLAREENYLNGRDTDPDSNLVFYVDDDTLAEGLDMMIHGDIPVPADRASHTAGRIESYLTRKVGAALDSETVDHIAQLIRDEPPQGVNMQGV